jgi:hypothetical protein
VLEADFKSLPAPPAQDSEQWGSTEAHRVQTLRLEKYNLKTYHTPRNSDNIFSVILFFSNGNQPTSTSEWREAIYDSIAADRDTSLTTQLYKWRQADQVVDVRCLPYAAALLGRVIAVWPARLGRNPILYIPPGGTVDTPVVHLRWANYDGRGSYNHFTPLRASSPLASEPWVEVVREQFRRQLPTTRNLDRCEAPEFSPTALRQWSSEARDVHVQEISNGVGHDRCWGLQEGSTAQLTDNNLEDYLLAYASTHKEVRFTGYSEGSVAGPTQPRVWCLGTNFHTLLKTDGVTKLL